MSSENLFYQTGSTDINCLDYSLLESQKYPNSKILFMILKDENNNKKFHFLLENGHEKIEAVRNKVYKSTLEFGVIPRLKKEQPVKLIALNKNIAKFISLILRKKLKKIDKFVKQNNQ